MEDNFAMIAANTTKYYLELERNYKHRFGSETSLIATAGVLDAQNYIFVEETIDLSSILNIAKEASTYKENALVEFITLLEIEIFKVDNPTIAPTDIVAACNEKKKDIVDAVQRTKEEYLSEPLFTSVVSDFLEFPQFKSYRQMLDLID